MTASADRSRARRARSASLVALAALSLCFAAADVARAEDDGPAADGADAAKKPKIAVVFSADDGRRGSSLWITDGTPKGTKLVLDVNPGPERADINQIARLKNGVVLFSAKDFSAPKPHGEELWITDGTKGGTKLLKDINPGTEGSNIGWLKPMGGGRAMFKADTKNEGGELWISNGKPGGTKLVKDIFPGTHVDPFVGEIANSGTPWDIIELNGSALFRGQNGPQNTEPWISDGTAGGTRMLKELNPGLDSEGRAAGSGARDFLNLGDGRATFSATDGKNGGELYVTDGKRVTLVKDINPGPLGSSIGGLFFREQALLKTGQSVFSAFLPETGNELWTTDGTAAGTRLVKDINRKPDVFGDPGRSDPANMASTGDGRVLFSANDGVNGFELWITNGKPGGTKLVKDIATGSIGTRPNSSGPASFTQIKPGKFIFAASDPARGRELWITDGTPAGTKLLADINKGAGSSLGSYPRFELLGDGRAIFAANDGSTGQELWITDGTKPGTKLLKDINPGEGSSNPTVFTALNAPR